MTRPKADQYRAVRALLVCGDHTQDADWHDTLTKQYCRGCYKALCENCAAHVHYKQGKVIGGMVDPFDLWCATCAPTRQTIATKRKRT